MPETIIVEGLTNQEFFERYAAPGRVGLIGGPELINRLIMRAQRHLNEQHTWSLWSHAFLLQGRRHDGHHWVVESDLDIKPKHIRLGVQENRAAKYFDDTKNTSVAIIDFGLTPEQEQRVLAGALELVSEGIRYSLREIAGTLWAMRHAGWCPRSRRFIVRPLCGMYSTRRASISPEVSRKKTPRPSTSSAPPCPTPSGS